MNVERWVSKRRPIWQQLEDLLNKIDRSGVTSLDKEELQALGRLYRSISADLSRARALQLSADIQSFLNSLALRAHYQVYQSKKNGWLDLFNFLYATFPSLVRKNIAYVALAFVICVVPGLVCYDFIDKDVNFARMEFLPGKPLVGDDMWDMIEHKKMWTDDLQDASPMFSSAIATNNIRVSVLAFTFGISAGIGTFLVLFFNGMSIGTIFGVCKHFGMLPNILLFVVGHGSLELPAIFISGGAGLLLGKSMLFPGAYKRIDSMKVAAKQALGLFGGCIPLLLIAGLIEGYISPRTDLSGEVKVLVGIAAFVCLLLYLFIPREPLRPKNLQTSSVPGISA